VLRIKSNDVLAPAGSRVTGRIVRMQHQFGKRPGFVVAISFDTIVIQGVPSPFFVRLTGRGTLDFSTTKSRHIVPAGFKTEWRSTSGATK
jgi:hypothetical protein